MKRRKALGLHSFTLFGLLITLLGFAIRLHHLGGDSFWVDEMATVETSRTLSGALAAERDHPPLTYLLTHIALEAWGESEFTARLPALFAGTLTLPLLALFGKRLGRPGAGLWAAFLLALAPFHLRYAQEARHYAWLLLFSLASYILLQRALRHPTWRHWLLFALVVALNLYTHFAAFLVLATQVVIIGIWLLAGWGPKLHLRLRVVSGAALLTILLYAPWLPRLWSALPHNVGPETVTDSGSTAGVALWWRNVMLASAGGMDALGLILVALSIAGLLILAHQRDGRTLMALLIALLLPPLLIPVLGIARGAMPRYLIFLLPLFLLAAGIALDAILQAIERVRGVRTAAIVAGLGGLIFLLLSVPRLRAEHDFMVGDWRGIADYLEAHAEGQPVLTLALNFPNGYNISAASLPYYYDEEPLLIAGHQLQPADGRILKSAEEVWFVVHDWNSGNALMDSPDLQREYQTALYLVRRTGNGLRETIAFYETLIPQSDAPAPQCLLRQDLAALYLASGDVEMAAHLFLEATKQCPHTPEAASESGRRQLRRAIADQLTNQMEVLSAGASAEVSTRLRLAGLLLALQPDNPAGPAALTAIDLTTAFSSGKAVTLREDAAEPIRLSSFTMPGGEPTQVLLMHPLAAVSYPLSLPDEPVALYFRVALDPESWEWGGDGATFVVYLESEGQGEVELYRRHISADVPDRTWHPATLSLEEYTGQTITLTLATEPGPNGDFTADWAGWERPRLLWQP